MRIKYKITDDDLIAFHRFHSAHSRVAHRRHLVWDWMVPLGVFVLSCLAGWRTRSWAHPVSGAMFAIVYVGIVQVSQRWLVERHVRKQLREGPKKDRAAERELEITETGIVGRTPYEENRTTWDGIERIGLTPDYAFIYTGALAAYVVRKAGVFEGDYDAFVTEISERIASKPEPQEVGKQSSPTRRVIIDTKEIFAPDRAFGRHSALGIVSFVISLAVASFYVFLLVLLAILSRISPQLMDRSSPALRVFTLGLILCPLANLVGLVLGIAGVCKKNRKKALAILALAFNIAGLLAFTVLMLIVKYAS